MISDIFSKNQEESVLCTETELASISSLASVTSLSDVCNFALYVHALFLQVFWLIYINNTHDVHVLVLF